MSFEKKRINYSWGKLNVDTHAVKIDTKKRYGKSGEDSDINSMFDSGNSSSDNVTMDDPRIIYIGIKTLRDLGYLFVHRQGTGVQGNRRNYYMVGSISDPDSQQNHITNIPEFIKLGYVPYGNSKGIFYIFMQSTTGEWELLEKSSTPMPLNL